MAGRGRGGGRRAWEEGKPLVSPHVGDGGVYGVAGRGGSNICVHWCDVGAVMSFAAQKVGPRRSSEETGPAGARPWFVLSCASCHSNSSVNERHDSTLLTGPNKTIGLAGRKKDHPVAMNRSKATPSTTCQKCLKKGHFSYECKASHQDRPYISRPSRTQQLLNPKLAPKITNSAPKVEVPK